jgi:hypothetical protein
MFCIGYSKIIALLAGNYVMLYYSQTVADPSYKLNGSPILET